MPRHKTVVELAKHLVSDKAALRKLKAVEQYISQLKADKKDAVRDMGYAKDELSAARANHNNELATIQELRRELESAQARIKNLDRDFLVAAKENERLEELLEPPLPTLSHAPSGRIPDIERVMRIAKELRRRVKVPPILDVSLKGPKFEIPVELSELVWEFSHEQYVNLGMFVSLMCLMGFKVRVSDAAMDRANGAWEPKHIEQFMRWFCEWMQPHLPPEGELPPMVRRPV